VTGATAALLLSSLASGLLADARADLERSLAGFSGSADVHVQVSVEMTRKSAGRFANSGFSGSASAEASVDRAGMTIRFSPETLARAAHEEKQQSADPNRTAPTRAAIRELDPLSLADSFDFTDTLRHLLSTAKTASETRVSVAGRGARLLVLHLDVKLPKEARSVWNVRFTEDQLRVWVADDGTPLAAERTRKGSAGFMFIRGEMRSRDHWTFTRSSDRLLVSRHESTFLGTGLGQRGEGKTIVTLRAFSR
jgi:hypothetical protein